jgi:hypothetical protein
VILQDAGFVRGEGRGDVFAFFVLGEGDPAEGRDGVVFVESVGVRKGRYCQSYHPTRMLGDGQAKEGATPSPIPCDFLAT